MIGVIGVSALSLEYGHGLLQRTENQRVADLAAYGGALVYGSTSSTSSATGAASNIAALNGISSGVSPSVVSSPTGDGNNALKVVVTTNPCYYARVLTTNTTMPVSATSYAEIKSSAPGCIIALNGASAGITMNGGTNVDAANCAVASDKSLTLSGGAALVTQNVDYATTAPSVSGGASITPPAGDTLHTNKVNTTDPLAPSSGSPGSTEVTNATARISTVSSITAPGAPIVTIPAGGAVSFTKAGVAGLRGQVVRTFWPVQSAPVACTGTANFGTITLNKVTVVIQTSAGNTYNFPRWPLPNGVTLSGCRRDIRFWRRIPPAAPPRFLLEPTT